jgi:ABC-2 type transport system permease protein
MKYALLIAWREFAESIKAKGFWIGIFTMPVILFFTIQVPVWLEQKATPVRNFVLVDRSSNYDGVVVTAIERAHARRVIEALEGYSAKYANARATSPEAQRLAATLAEISGGGADSLDEFIKKGGKDPFLEKLGLYLRADAPPFKEPRRLYRRVNLPSDVNPDAGVTELAAQLKPYLRGDKQFDLDGQPANLYLAVLIPAEIENYIVRPERKTNRSSGSGANGGEPSHQIQFWSTDVTSIKQGEGLGQEIERAVNTEVRRREYQTRGLDVASIRQVEHTYVPFLSLNPKKAAGREAVNTTDIIKQWAPSGFVYLLWLAIFVIVQMLLNNTIEEKSNRIIEVLLSSVTPGELMMGKLFGIAAVGMTMIGCWMLSLFSILSWKSGGASEIAGQMLAVMKTSNLVPLFSVYFVLGYLLYAAFFLAIGSVCNTIKEAQSYMGLFTLVMMVPLMTMMFIPKDPNGPLARVLSWIPLYTPFTMMNRANADPPWIDLVGTLIMLVAATALALWATGKIFRIGILRTGQPPRILEMLRWAVRKA